MLTSLLKANTIAHLNIIYANEKVKMQALKYLHDMKYQIFK